MGKSGVGLTYRGYDIVELAEKATFDEVAYLMVQGELPNKSQLAEYQDRLKPLRALPTELLEVLERIPADSHPMEVMRTGCSMLGNLRREEGFSQQQQATDQLLAALPGIILYWYRYSHEGVRISPVTDEDCIGGHFLRLLQDKSPGDLHRRAMDVAFVLYAEHEFNASTFAARVCASSLSDMYSCVTASKAHIGSSRFRVSSPTGHRDLRAAASMNAASWSACPYRVSSILPSTWPRSWVFIR